MTDGRRTGLMLAGLALLAGSTLVGCTVSAAAGSIGGAIGALLLVGALVFGVGAQSGCDSARPVQSDGGADARIGPCLSMPLTDGGLDVHVGPCLGAPATDAYVGPCLDPLPPDGGFDLSGDANVGPCLKVMFDGGLDQGGSKVDAGVGPCLSAPINDASSSLDEPLRPRRLGAPAAPAGEAERRAVIEKLAANLPADVLARLRGRHGG